LPLPSELISATNVQAESAKTASDIYSIEGFRYSMVLPNSGVSPDWQERNAYMIGQYSPLSFCLYPFLFSIEGGEVVESVCLHVDWQGNDPPEGRGLFLALPDWERNTWRWFGFQDHLNTWQTIEDGYTMQGSQTDYLAVVNYSNTDAVIADVHFDINQEGEVTDDAWLYYTVYTEDGPDTYGSITRVNPTTGHHQWIVEGDASHSYSRPYFVLDGPFELLAYSRQISGQDTDVGFIGIDGSGAEEVYTRPGEDILPAGFSASGGQWLYLVKAGPADFDLFYKLGAETTKLRSHPVLDACWDLTGLRDVNALYVRPSPVIAEGTEIWYISSDTTPDPPPEEEVVLKNDDQAFRFLDPSTYVLDSGSPAIYAGIFYAGGAPGEETSVYRYPTHSFVTAEPQLWESYPGRDLRYPVLSPDGRWLAYLRCMPGEETGELLVAEYAVGRDAVPVLLADFATGPLCWYDPTP